MAADTLIRTDLRVPRFATTDLSGARVLGTDVVGKHLLIRLDRAGDLITLHSHLRMDGRWATGPASDRPCAGPAHNIRVWLVGERAQAVGLRLMEVAVVATSADAELIGHLGPDILAAEWDAASVADRVRAQGDRGLVDTVLDQTVVCGIGTMWAAELAFTARVDPDHPASATTGLPEALTRIRQRMRRAIIDDRRASRARLNVFERSGYPCLRCGVTVRSGRVADPPHDRITYWCPGCQAR